MRTLIIVPPHNQAGNVDSMLERIRRAAPADDDVLVVDDTSTDNTRSLVPERVKTKFQVCLQTREAEHQKHRQHELPVSE